MYMRKCKHMHTIKHTYTYACGDMLKYANAHVHPTHMQLHPHIHMHTRVHARTHSQEASTAGVPAWKVIGARGRARGVLDRVALLRMAASSPPMASTLPAGTACVQRAGAHKRGRHTF